MFPLHRHDHNINEFRWLIFGDDAYDPRGHEISRGELSDYASSLTGLSIMNFRFLGPTADGDYEYPHALLLHGPRTKTIMNQYEGTLLQ